MLSNFKNKKTHTTYQKFSETMLGKMLKSLDVGFVEFVVGMF